MQEKEKQGSSWNFAAAFVNAWAMTCYLFLRLNVGKRHVGVNGLLGVAWMFLVGLQMHSNDMLILIGLFVLGQISHQLGHAAGKAEIVHSRYAGDSIVAKLFPFLGDAVARQIGEPLIVLIAGLALMQYSEAIGVYLFYGSGAMVVNQMLVSQYQRNRDDDMQDGMIESQHLMGQIRNRRR